MSARRDYRDRDDVEVEILDALVDRSDDGMTVFELRTRVETDIDDLEAALARLNDDGLVTVEEENGRTVILPDEGVVPASGDDDRGTSFYDRIKERLPF